MNKIKQNIIILLIFIVLFSLPNIVKATELIYDYPNTQNYKTLVIKDNLNIQYINDYDYTVYLNNSLYGKFKKNDLILIPDNTTITIYFSPPIKTDVSDIYQTIIKPVIITVLGFLFTWGLIIIIILMIVMKLFNTYIRNRR